MSRIRFRQEALDHLHAENEFNDPILIVSPKRWIWLIGIYAIIAAVILFSVFGKIPIEVQGLGILNLTNDLTKENKKDKENVLQFLFPKVHDLISR